MLTDGIMGSSKSVAKVEDDISQLTDALKGHKSLKKLELTGNGLLCHNTLLITMCSVILVCRLYIERASHETTG